MSSRAPAALTHLLATTALVVVIATVVLVVGAARYAAVRDDLAELTARTTGVVTAATGDTIVVRWDPGRGPVDRAVELAVSTPPVGAAVEVAHDPDDPRSWTVPGAARLASGERALADAALAAVVLAGVPLLSVARLLPALHARRRPAVRATVRRVRVRSGLVNRSWFETEDEPQRWIPVRFDPVLMTLPAPVAATLHGDVRRHRWVAVTVGGRTLLPSGRMRAREPAGRRTDDPAQPDAGAAGRAARTGTARHLRVDLALTVPAPLVGLLWAFVIGGGAASSVAVTAMSAAVGLWTGALRGSDPT